MNITDCSKPALLSVFPVPLPPADAPYSDFCDKAVRFGLHNLNHHQHSSFVEQDVPEMGLDGSTGTHEWQNNER